MLHKSFLHLLFFVNFSLLSMEAPIESLRPVAVTGKVMKIINGKMNYTKSGTKWTSMHDAAFFGPQSRLEKEVAECKRSGQSIDPKDIYGQSPLFWLAKRAINKPKECAGSMRLLVENGADLEQVDLGGISPISLIRDSELLKIINDAKKGIIS